MLGSRPLELRPLLSWRCGCDDLYRRDRAARHRNEKEATPSPKRDDETEYEAYLRNHHVFGRFQGDIEVALSSIMYTADEFRAGAH